MCANKTYQLYTKCLILIGPWEEEYGFDAHSKREISAIG
jgi:hypothetical protein